MLEAEEQKILAVQIVASLLFLTHSYVHGYAQVSSWYLVLT